MLAQQYSHSTAYEFLHFDVKLQAKRLHFVHKISIERIEVAYSHCEMPQVKSTEKRFIVAVMRAARVNIIRGAHL